MTAATELANFTSKLEATKELQRDYQAVKARASELSAEVTRSRSEIGTRDKRIAALEKEVERVTELEKQNTQLEGQLRTANRALDEANALNAANAEKVESAERFAELVKDFTAPKA